MSRRPRRPRNPCRTLLAAILLVASGAASASAPPIVEPPFDEDYALIDLGDVDGLPIPYGGVAFVPGDAHTIVVTGYAGTEIATLYAVALERDETGSISGFAGPAVPAVEAYAAGGGMAYGPGNVLFYGRVTLELGQVKPGSSITDKVLDLHSLYWRPSGLNFVPPGLGGGGGALKLVTFSYGQWWSLDIAPDGNGTYNVTGATFGPSLQGNPTGFAYVAPETAGFFPPGLLVCEHELSYGAGKVVMYDVDAQGDPIVATRRVVVSGLDTPEGIAVDPVMGDVLFANDQGELYLLRSTPLPTTTSTTSSTTSSSTSTSTSTSAPSTTSSSTTRPPTTTTSTTVPPSTTSSSSTTSTTTTTATSTSSSTTTLPSPCGIQPSFAWIGCRVDALLAVVRASSELGSFQARFAARLEETRATLAESMASCADGDEAAARQALDRVARQMLLLRARTRTQRARRTIPRPLAAFIRDEARGIAADARALRAELVCA